MFQVKTKPNEQQFSAKEGESILEAAIRQKVMVPYGCGKGECGACKVIVSQGEYEYLHGYKPKVLSQEECSEGVMLCCMAKAMSDLEVIIPENSDYPKIEIETYQSQVKKIKPLTDSVYQLILEIDSGQFDYYPGQYIEILLPDGHKRAYSLASLIKRNEENLTQEVELHIRLHENGLFSNLLKHEISVGDPLSFEGPKGGFLLNQDFSSKTVFVAGGTGIVPIKLLLDIRLDKAKNEDIYLFWGVKDQQELFHNDYFNKLYQENSKFHYIPVLTEPDLRMGNWRGATGIVSNSVVEEVPDLAGSQVYAAGPQAMIQSCQNIFPAFGLAEENFYMDIFLQPGKDSRRKKKNFFQKLFS